MTIRALEQLLDPTLKVLHGRFAVTFSSNVGQLTVALPDDERRIGWVFLSTSMQMEGDTLVLKSGVGRSDQGDGILWRFGRLIAAGPDAPRFYQHLQTLGIGFGQVEAELRHRTDYVEGTE